MILPCEQQVNTLITINISTRVFTAFFCICHSLWQMPWFTAVVLACVAWLMPLLAIYSCSHFPLLNTCRRASVVTDVEETNKQCTIMQKWKKGIPFPGWDKSFCQKRTKTTCVATHRSWCFYHWLCTPLTFFQICLLTRKREYSCSYSACWHLIWNIGLIRIWTIIGVCCVWGKVFDLSLRPFVFRSFRFFNSQKEVNDCNPAR